MGKLSFNDGALRHIAQHRPPDREGRLQYRQSNDSYKERYFKLCGNLLFYFRTNDRGVMSDPSDPIGVLVLASCNVKLEEYGDRPFVFSIVFDGEDGRKHFFSGQTMRHCADWVEALQNQTYVSQIHQMENLRQKIKRRTGMDPLAATVASTFALQQPSSGQQKIVSAPNISKQPSAGSAASPLNVSINSVTAGAQLGSGQKRPPGVVKRQPPAIPPPPQNYQPAVFFVGNTDISSSHAAAIKPYFPAVQRDIHSSGTDTADLVSVVTDGSKNQLVSSASKVTADSGICGLQTADVGFKTWEKFE